MFIIKQSNDLSKYLYQQRASGNSIGFVPTMGALHRGHISLIRQAKKERTTTVCSIFVNPTQFNDPKDFEHYPHTIENDIYLLEKENCDVLFLPGVTEIYASGTKSLEKYELGYIETVLEGKYRPGHFQGVCQVIQRLMSMVDPDSLYIGQKDYQQCMVIKKLLSFINSKSAVIICPTLRENDGLAMSSRNMRLNEEERQKATGIYKALSYIHQNIKPGLTFPVLEKAREILITQDLVPDYIEIAAADTLEPIPDWNGRTNIVALIAAFMGKVRLIDNMILPLNFANYAN
ncbi:MAG: pantoate--beta-alanine ligase [Agriterribacter sp.]